MGLTEVVERAFECEQSEGGWFDPADYDAVMAAVAFGEAWAEAEAALPEGWRIAALDSLLPGSRQEYAEGWAAEANLVVHEKWTGTTIEGQGDTPVTALLDLAAKLRVHAATACNASA